MGCVGPYLEGNGEHSCRRWIQKDSSMCVVCGDSGLEAWEGQGKATEDVTRHLGHNPLSSPTGVGRGRWLSFPNLLAAPLHHEARHSRGSESQAGSTWSTPACNSSQGVCTLSSKPRLQHTQQTPQPGVPQRTDAACIYVPVHMTQLGLPSALPTPGPTSSLQLSLCSLPHLWGC